MQLVFLMVVSESAFISSFKLRSHSSYIKLILDQLQLTRSIRVVKHILTILNIAMLPSDGLSSQLNTATLKKT